MTEAILGMIRNVVPHRGGPLAAGGFGTLGSERSARTKTRLVRIDRPRLLAGDELDERVRAAAEVFEGRFAFSLGGRVMGDR
jgi:hypothetical protein